jgi:hypothetical protein
VDATHEVSKSDDGYSMDAIVYTTDVDMKKEKQVEPTNGARKTSLSISSDDYLWNELFQATSESIADLPEDESVLSLKQEKEVLDNYIRLRNLAQSFVATATYLH